MKKRLLKVLGIGVTLALLSSLTVAPLAGALSQAVVTIATGDAVISKVDADYTIRFTLDKDLEPTDVITVTFPSDTAIANTATGGVVTATIQASPGWVAGTWANAVVAGVTWAGVATTRTITATLGVGDQIGEGSEVRLAITAGITNPSTVGDYTLTVKTTDEPTAVTSASYSIAAPTVPALPGIVEVYNPGGIKMASFTGPTAIANALNPAVSGIGVGFTVSVGPGTYTENPASSAASQIIKASGSAAETVIVGNFNIAHASVTVQGFTISGNMAITGDKVTVKDNVFIKTGTATTTPGEILVTYNNAAATPTGTISGNTFDTTLGAVADTAIQVVAGGVAISSNTFTVDSTVALADDIAIDTDSGMALYPVAISGCTITGASGVGVQATDTGALGTPLATIADSTLSGLTTALTVTGGTITVSGTTISGCGRAAVATLGILAAPVINVASAPAPAVVPTLTITNSVITGNLDEILEVDAEVGGNDDAGLVTLRFNDLSGNAKGIDNNAGTGTVNAQVNWWGAATGPAATFNSGADTAGYTGGIASGSAAAASASLTAGTTRGVDVSIVTAAGALSPAGLIAVGRYAANPGEATPEPALADGFYDVYVTAPANITDVATIKLYNTAITEDTVAYVWSDLGGTWAPCSSQGVNTFSGYVWVQVSGTSVPSLLDLAGTPFALCEPEVAPPSAPAAPGVLTPTFGDEDVDLKPTFTWTASAGATSYEFVLAEEIGQDDKFAIIDYSATTATHGHVAREQLKYSTVYNWRVRAVSDAGKSAWTTAFFTTAAEPEPEPEPTPPVIVKEIPPSPAPEIILEVPPTEAPVNVIPDYLLWTVVGIGAVLIIAVVVLIVRTRRVT
jgi:hypothetical protein